MVALIGAAARLPGTAELTQTLYYAVAGLAWVIPAGLLITWMQREPQWPPADRDALIAFGLKHDTYYVKVNSKYINDRNYAFEGAYYCLAEAAKAGWKEHKDDGSFAVYDGQVKDVFVTARSVDFRDFSGFTGSYWVDNIGKAEVSGSADGKYTITGSANGAFTDNPSNAVTATFRIEADC